MLTFAKDSKEDVKIKVHTCLRRVEMSLKSINLSIDPISIPFEYCIFRGVVELESKSEYTTIQNSRSVENFVEYAAFTSAGG